jgi:hypothetical protein
MEGGGVGPPSRGGMSRGGQTDASGMYVGHKSARTAKLTKASETDARPSTQTTLGGGGTSGGCGIGAGLSAWSRAKRGALRKRCIQNCSRLARTECAPPVCTQCQA